MSEEFVGTSQTTLHLLPPIDCLMGIAMLRQHQVCCESGKCVVGCDVLVIDDVRAAVCADLEDKE